MDLSRTCLLLLGVVCLTTAFPTLTESDRSIFANAPFAALLHNRNLLTEATDQQIACCGCACPHHPPQTLCFRCIECPTCSG